MNAPSEFTADQAQAAVTGKKFYTWDEIAANPKLWVALLWRAMFLRGKGYRKGSQSRTGKIDKDGKPDRRKDKVEGPLSGCSKAFRSYGTRYASPPIKQSPRQKRRARAMGGR